MHPSCLMWQVTRCRCKSDLQQYTIAKALGELGFWNFGLFFHPEVMCRPRA